MKAEECESVYCADCEYTIANGGVDNPDEVASEHRKEMGCERFLVEYRWKFTDWDEPVYVPEPEPEPEPEHVPNPKNLIVRRVTQTEVYCLECNREAGESCLESHDTINVTVCRKCKGKSVRCEDHG